ncbi:Dynein heavy chain 5, axonemal [Armadillidium nasatum]|uniref:Dynein heavy chain 5, axonemal n=1 Tax=Armadillidium nasatum TaxID=96803 RepID=A0A5N5TJB1_9CRUS|nr:Dynein heavy chain 5, axonemal [Armadillidium nasatum]
MCAEISRKKYDYLEYKDDSFDKDLEVFAGSIRELLRRVHVMVEKEHEEIWDTPMALKMLARFEGISSVVPNLDVVGKHKKILSRFLQESEKVLKLYNRLSENPPPIQGLPPISGKIQWARGLFKHMEEPMMFFKDHPDLLHKYPEGKEALRRYNRIGRTLVLYEIAYYDMWRKQNFFRCIFSPLGLHIEI